MNATQSHTEAQQSITAENQKQRENSQRKKEMPFKEARIRQRDGGNCQKAGRKKKGSQEKCRSLNNDIDLASLDLLLTKQ